MNATTKDGPGIPTPVNPFEAALKHAAETRMHAQYAREKVIEATHADYDAHTASRLRHKLADVLADLAFTVSEVERLADHPEPR